MATTSWVYVMEIDPRWIPLLGSRIPEGTTRLLYVGYTESGPGERAAQHLTGLSRPGHPNESAARIFRRIRRAREAQGLPGPLVDGEDAWLRPDLVEQFADAAQGHAREGELADELRGIDGTYAWSDAGQAADDRREHGRKRTRRCARRRRRRER